MMLISERDFSSILLADYVKREDVVCGGFETRSPLKASKEPVWNLVFPRGTWHGRANFERFGGTFTVDDAFLEEVIANYRAAGSPRLPVRWTHEHLKNTDPAKVPLLDRKAANIIDLRATEAGLEGLTQWNAAGRKDIEDGVFDAWSAEWAPRHENRLTGKVGGWFLSGVALTGEPFFNLMPQLAAQEMPPVAASARAETTEPNHKEQHMTKEQLEALRTKLGLAADATVEQILTASAQLVAERDALKAEATKLKASAPTAEVITAAVAPVKAQVEALTAELAKRDAALLERDVDAIIATAKRGDGKTGRAINDVLVATAKKLAATDGLKAAQAFIEALPLSVPLAPLGTLPGDGTPLTAEVAGKKIQARAEELRAKGDPTPMITAMREMPELTLIAEGRSAPRATSN